MDGLQWKTLLYKMDDLEGPPLFSETSTWNNWNQWCFWFFRAVSLTNVCHWTSRSFSWPLGWIYGREFEKPRRFWGRKCNRFRTFTRDFLIFLSPVIYVISRYGLKLVWISVVTRFAQEKTKIFQMETVFQNCLRQWLHLASCGWIRWDEGSCCHMVWQGWLGCLTGVTWQLGSFFGTERFHSFTNVTASRLPLVMASLLSALDFTAPWRKFWQFLQDLGMAQRLHDVWQYDKKKWNVLRSIDQSTESKADLFFKFQSLSFLGRHWRLRFVCMSRVGQVSKWCY